MNKGSFEYETATQQKLKKNLASQTAGAIRKIYQAVGALFETFVLLVSPYPTQAIVIIKYKGLDLCSDFLIVQFYLMMRILKTMHAKRHKHYKRWIQGHFSKYVVL